MIYCPECGTANRDGSKFCNECGYQLGSRTGVKCPQCGTMNSIQSVFCSECGGRLLSLSTPTPGPVASPIKGLSLPTKPEVGEDAAEKAREPEADEEIPEDEVPSWLRELGDTRPASMAGQPREGDLLSPAASAAEEIPDWLRDLGASLPEELDDTKLVEAPAAPMPPLPAVPLPTVGTGGMLRDEAPEAEALPGEPAPEEVPDWLAELQRGEAPAAPMPPLPAVPLPTVGTGGVLREGAEAPLEEPAPEEVPDWLAELQRGEAPAAPMPPLPAAPGAEAPLGEAAPEEAPDWLDEIQPVEAAAALTPPSLVTPPLPTAPLPTVGTGGVLREEAETPLGEPEGVPDWLRDLGIAGVAAKAVAGRPADEVLGEDLALPGEMPDWLTALRPAAAEPVPPPSPATAAEIPEAAEMPDWLSDLRAQASPPASAERLGPSQGIPTVEGEQAEDLAEQVVGEAFEEGLLSDGQGSELQDWLVPTPEDLELEGETLARAQIPDWLLALKPSQLRAEEGEATGAALAAEGVIEQTGLLAGIRNVLPVEMLIAQPRAAAPATAEAAPVETPQAQLFAQIVALPLVTAPKTLSKPEARLVTPLARGVIFVVLLLLVTVPLLLKEPLFERKMEPSPSATALYDVVDSLNNGDPVLVAFDYDPATSGEMDVLAELLVSHLMEKQVRIIVVSLLPTGPSAAQSLVEKVAADYPGYQDDQGNRYVNLGYLPGQAAAVRLMSQSLSEALPRDYAGRLVASLPVMAGIANAQDFDLIVELAAGADTLRWWIEQAGTPYDISLVAGVSAAVDPVVRPYYETESRQLQGEIGGILGAADYDSLRAAARSASDEAGLSQPMAALLDSQLAGHVGIILAIVVGNSIGLVGLMRGRTGRKL
jgi:Double zinc ribbon